MIDISLVIDDKGIITEIISIGHAETHWFKRLLGCSRYHAVCAAVSTLEYNYLHSVEALTRSDAKADIRNGSFELHLVYEDAAVEVLKVLSSALLIGFDAVSREHGDHIRIKKL